MFAGEGGWGVKCSEDSCATQHAEEIEGYTVYLTFKNYFFSTVLIFDSPGCYIGGQMHCQE